MKLIWYEAYGASSNLTSIEILATFHSYKRTLGLRNRHALCVSGFKPVNRYHETFYECYAISIPTSYVVIYKNWT